jgi:hypothetical protein
MAWTSADFVSLECAGTGAWQKAQSQANDGVQQRDSQQQLQYCKRKVQLPDSSSCNYQQFGASAAVAHPTADVAPPSMAAVMRRTIAKSRKLNDSAACAVMSAAVTGLAPVTL